MIDYLSLALTHALLIVALLRLLRRPDIDREEMVLPETEVEKATRLALEEADVNTPAARAARRKSRRDA